MQIISSDFKKGFVKLRVDDKEDLWYLSHLIDQGDFIKGKTTRKIKIGENENAKTVKKVYNLKIEAETVDYNEEVLRINGKIKEGPEELPHDSYQSIPLEIGSEFSLEKKSWLSYQKQKLKEATEKKYSYLICLFDREEALFALTKNFGYELLVNIKGEVTKKAEKVMIKNDFHQELIKTLEEYNHRYNPEKIILASPAFYKDDLFKKINLPELKNKIVLAICSGVNEAIIDEVLKRPELKNTLKSSRTRDEKMVVEELLSEINKNNLAVYGLVEVEKAVNSGAVIKLLITDEFIKKKRTENDYDFVDKLMKLVDSLNGEIHIISSENESGKKLDGLGGIAAILRYKLEWQT